MNFLLSAVAVISIGLMIGVEFAVWVFINPILRQLANGPRAQAIVLFARKLGTTMPFWYGANLLLLVAEWILFRHAPGAPLLATAVGLWSLVIVLTLIFLVPINNRMAREETHASAEQAHNGHKRWDSMHRACDCALRGNGSFSGSNSRLIRDARSGQGKKVKAIYSPPQPDPSDPPQPEIPWAYIALLLFS